MIIRPYRPEDFHPVTALWRRSRLHTFPDLEARVGHTVEQDHAYFRDVIATKNSLWVAELGGQAAGFLAIAGDFVDQLFVDPERQRGGVGSALLEQARRLSPTGLRLFTLQSNVNARAFYEKHGFAAMKFGVSPPPESEPDVEYRWRPEEA